VSFLCSLDMASNIKLSDEELDIIESGDMSALNESDNFDESLIDIKIDLEAAIKRLTPDEQTVILAKLQGETDEDIGVSKKYWRYHLTSAISKLSKELN